MMNQKRLYRFARTILLATVGSGIVSVASAQDGDGLQSILTTPDAAPAGTVAPANHQQLEPDSTPPLPTDAKNPL